MGEPQKGEVRRWYSWRKREVALGGQRAGRKQKQTVGGKKKPINYGSIRINQPHDPMSGGRRKPALSVVKVGKILKPKETGQDGSGRC